MNIIQKEKTMRKDNRETLKKMLAEGERRYPDLLAKCMLKFDYKYMLEEYPEIVLKYPEWAPQELF